MIAYKKAANTLQKYFGDKDPAYRKYKKTYEKLAREAGVVKTPIIRRKSEASNGNIHINENIPQPHDPMRQAIAPNSMNNAFRANGKRNSGANKQLPPMSNMNTKDNSYMEDMESAYTKKVNPTNNRKIIRSKHNKSTLDDNNNILDKTNNSKIKEIIYGSDDDVLHNIDIQQNMLNFFDNMINYVGPNHL